MRTRQQLIARLYTSSARCPLAALVKSSLLHHSRTTSPIQTPPSLIRSNDYPRLHHEHREHLSTQARLTPTASALAATAVSPNPHIWSGSMSGVHRFLSRRDKKSSRHSSPHKVCSSLLLSTLQQHSIPQHAPGSGWLLLQQSRQLFTTVRPRHVADRARPAACHG